MLPSGSNSAFQLTSGTVPPGQTLDVSVSLKAPDAGGTYQGYWRLGNASGVSFGIGKDGQTSFWVKIIVPPPATATPIVSGQLDFIALGPVANWQTTQLAIVWGDRSRDQNGVAAAKDSYKLNDGQTYNNILLLFPQNIENGIIMGRYPSYAVQDKDRFVTALGFGDPCGFANVHFELQYREAGVDYTVARWDKTCDTSLTSISVDLSGLKGKIVEFILFASTNGAFKDDYLMLVAPRIER
jgi:hypothetical protein